MSEEQQNALEQRLDAMLEQSRKQSNYLKHINRAVQIVALFVLGLILLYGCQFIGLI